MDDLVHMRHALGLAARGLGRTAPNPSVGCVIIDAHGRVAGRGWTQPGGRPHAEAVALAEAGPRARGATAYVTLEPCAHTGHTGPCAQALLTAGVSRVVSALEDPDPRVAGRGHDMLRAGGISVEIGPCADQARLLNAGFFRRLAANRPVVTLKIATSLDGRMALSNGQSQWITGPDARRAGHLLRSRHDAIVTGIGTVLSDDPRFDCRLDGMANRSPAPVVLDTHARLPATAKLFGLERAKPLIWCVGPDANPAPHPKAELVRAELDAKGHLDLVNVMGMLAERGHTRALVEAGPALATAILSADLADEIVWFRAPMLMGGDAWAAIAPLNLTALSQARRFRRVAVSQWGADLMETYRPTA